MLTIFSLSLEFLSPPLLILVGLVEFAAGLTSAIELQLLFQFSGQSSNLLLLPFLLPAVVFLLQQPGLLCALPEQVLAAILVKGVLLGFVPHLRVFSCFFWPVYVRVSSYLSGVHSRCLCSAFPSFQQKGAGFLAAGRTGLFLSQLRGCFGSGSSLSSAAVATFFRPKASCYSLSFILESFQAFRQAFCLYLCSSLSTVVWWDLREFCCRVSLSSHRSSASSCARLSSRFQLLSMDGFHGAGQERTNLLHVVRNSGFAQFFSLLRSVSLAARGGMFGLKVFPSHWSQAETAMLGFPKLPAGRTGSTAGRGHFPTVSGSISTHKRSIFRAVFSYFRPLSGSRRYVSFCLFWGRQQSDPAATVLLLSGFGIGTLHKPFAGCFDLLHLSLSIPANLVSRCSLFRAFWGQQQCCYCWPFCFLHWQPAPLQLQAVFSQLHQSLSRPSPTRRCSIACTTSSVQILLFLLGICTRSVISLLIKCLGSFEFFVLFVTCSTSWNFVTLRICPK
ncbi:hypothetical protein Salat_0680000 [Sesamum alatum]|uniref:Uncharacterized protein n=1 Tax=Sesamum alatum TaxID=300844 RepID=A0AAE2CUN1_9LAMI|nr:hypothetical protein Salat_0680000 [Sesamum alatum]